MLENNKDLIDRTILRGVHVHEMDDASVISLSCEDFEETDVEWCSNGLLLYLERDTGRIGACMVYDYKEYLFRRFPTLLRHLECYRAAREAGDLRKQADYSQKLFHSLVALSDPSMARHINTVYQVQSLKDRVFRSLRRGDWAGAAFLLDTIQQPDSEVLLLKSTVSRLLGKTPEWIEYALESYSKARDSRLRFTGRVANPAFAIGWQAVPKAEMGGKELEVIDTERPDNQINYSSDEPRVLAYRRQPATGLDNNEFSSTNAGVSHEKETKEPSEVVLVFTFGVRLPAEYAGYRYRVLVVDYDLRFQLNLGQSRQFRRVFSHALEHDGLPSSSPISPEHEHLLMAHSAVLTCNRTLLDGWVDTEGMVSINEPVESVGTAPEEFFSNKTVVLLLYREGAPAQV